MDNQSGKKPGSKLLSTLIFLVLIAVTIYVIVSRSGAFTGKDFLNYIRGADPLCLIAACLCMLLSIFCEGAALLVICDILGYRRSIPNGIVYSAADIYFSAITPSATGGQPASAFFMMQDGLPAIVTTTALLINLAMYTLSIVVLAALCFILCPSALLSFNTFGQIVILVGVVVQIALFIGFLLLIFRESLLIRIIDLFSKLLHKLRLGHRAENQKAKIEEMRADYRSSAGRIRAHKGKLIAAFLLNLVQRFSLMLIPVFVLLGAGGNPSDCVKALSTQGMVVLGSNFIPIPGAVGVSDMLFFDGFAALTDNVTCLELLSRSISFYISVLLCGLTVLTAYFIRKNRRKLP